MMHSRLILLIAAVCVPIAAQAQQPYPPTAPPAPPPPPPPAAAAPAPSPAALNFSGVLFGNFQYRGDAGPSKASNKFDVERVYLTFRMPAGDRASVRVTTDVFQQATTPNDAYYRGWVVRLKYAYLQYDYLKRADWNAVARAGLVHTVFIDHEEGFWARWISLTPVDRAGYFSSADAGLVTLVTLPRKLGEVYATITNGPGYTSRETDRFKDYALRLSLTPLSSSEQSYLRSFTLTGWGYRGAVGSKFSSGGAGRSGADRANWVVPCEEPLGRLRGLEGSATGARRRLCQAHRR
jgi:hypothetical protein